ncbi:MAG TPA: ATP-dependent zinc metalloprotease FtsH [Patescibacteria group bacterium]|nr:ATP-dependent zinc metalloprotease FtsH [Patescibacteria group bacterium]
MADAPKKKNHKHKIVKVKINMSWKNLLLYGVLLLFLLFLFAGINIPTENSQSVAISQIISDVKAGKVNQLTVTDTKLTATEQGKTLTATKESGVSIYSLFHDAGVNLNRTKVSVNSETFLNWVNIATNILPIVLMIAFFYFIFRQARGAQESIFSFGQSKARLFNKDNPKVTFADVAGVDEAKQELSEIVDFLKNPAKYKSMGARSPKGVLMVGPSGTGKTLLARATAGEAGTTFFSIAGSEFMEMLVGVGASRVRDLFSMAKKNQPAIIFIDEIDAIGRQRGVGLMGGHDEREQTLNQILVEMDGFTPNEQIVVVAATNRPDVLDPALVRPGRFDRKVTLDMPDIEGRKAILAIHAKGKPFTSDVNWEKVARRTVGFSGADLENMLNEAAILAARKDKKAIDMHDLEEAATKVKLGPEKRRLQSDEDKKITAYHEGGHAIVIWYLPHLDPVHRVSIVSRSMTLGHTMMEPAERSHETRTFILEQIIAMLGGRAAEQMVFNEMTTGASNDIEKATEVAREMVINYGMSDLGPVNLQSEKRYMYESRELSPEMLAKIDKEVQKIIDSCYEESKKILKKYKKELDKLAAELLRKETLEADEFAGFMGNKPKVASPFIEKPKKT